MADLPIGSIIMFDRVTPPVGWYDCNGATYGGITTPNLMGLFPKGVPTGGNLGAIGGSPTHSHANQNTSTASHGHGKSTGNSTVTATPMVDGIWSGNTYQGVESHGHPIEIEALSAQNPHVHTIPDSDAGSSMPPYIRLRYIMRCE